MVDVRGKAVYEIVLDQPEADALCDALDAVIDCSQGARTMVSINDETLTFLRILREKMGDEQW